MGGKNEKTSDTKRGSLRSFWNKLKGSFGKKSKEDKAMEEKKKLKEKHEKERMLYLEIIKNGEGGLDVLEGACKEASPNIKKLLDAQEELKTEIEKFNSNVKKAGKVLSKEQLQPLLDAKSTLEKVDRAIKKSFSPKALEEFVDPSVRFEKIKGELSVLKENMGEEDWYTKYPNKKDVAAVLDPISSYANKCINFNEDYKRSKTDVDELIDEIQKMNKAMKNLKLEESWMEYIASFLPSNQEMVKNVALSTLSYLASMTLASLIGA